MNPMSASGRPIVSVVVPTFNRARFLPDALESIFAQDVPNVEVIVIDDGSTDNTEAVLKAYESRIRYFRQDNRGSGSARNAGVSRASGDFVSFLDSDDVWLPGKMKADLRAFESNPEADAVICDCERWMENQIICRSWFRDREVPILSDKPFLLPTVPPRWVEGKIFATCCLTIRRPTLERLGTPPFDTTFETHEDWDFAIRMHHSCKILVNPRLGARVRRFDDGSRIGRPLPGTEYPPAVKCVMASRRYRVFEKALKLNGWSDEIVSRVEDACRSAALEVALNQGAGRRRLLARVLFAELRQKAFGNAAIVAGIGLFPGRMPLSLKSRLQSAGANSSSVSAVTEQSVVRQ